MGNTVRAGSGKATLAKLIFGVALFAFVASRCDLRSALSSLSTISLLVVISALVLTLLAHAVGSIKWRLLLHGVKLRDLFRIVMISNFYSFVFPGQIAGEISKVFKLGGNDARRREVMASIILDRLTGISAIALTGMAGAVLGSMRVPVPLVWGLVAVGAASIVMCLTPLAEVVSTLLARGLQAARDLRRSLVTGEASDAQQSLVLASRTHGRMAFALLLGIVYQLICIGMLMVLADGLGIRVAFFDWCLILSVMSIMTMLPITIAGIGVREGSLVGTLALVGVSSDAAFGMGIALFGMQLIFAAVGWVVDLDVFHYRVTYISR